MRNPVGNLNCVPDEFLARCSWTCRLITIWKQFGNCDEHPLIGWPVGRLSAISGEIRQRLASGREPLAGVIFFVEGDEPQGGFAWIERTVKVLDWPGLRSVHLN